MGHHFEVPTADDLMRAAVETIQSDGLRITPSKGGCREIVPASFELLNPRSRVSRSATRGRLFSALGELCWYLSGSNKTDDIAYYVPFYKTCDENGEIFGGYGPRLISFDGVNQIDHVVGTLRAKPSSRRAVIQLFDHRDFTVPHEDIPCTCTLQYLIREDHLSAITYMRSNDAFLGLPHDLFCFTMLQEIIARSVDVEIGTYHHIVGSLHIYDRNAKDLDAYIAEGWQATSLSMPAMPLGDPWPGIAKLLEVERQLREGAPPTDVDFGTDPYWGDLGRVLGVYAAGFRDRQVIEQINAKIVHEYYKSYIMARLDAFR